MLAGRGGGLSTTSTAALLLFVFSAATCLCHGADLSVSLREIKDRHQEQIFLVITSFRRPCKQKSLSAVGIKTCHSCAVADGTEFVSLKGLKLEFRWGLGGCSLPQMGRRGGHLNRLPASRGREYNHCLP